MTRGAARGAPAAADRIYTRNATAMVAWEAFWSLGVPSCLVATVIPAYLFALGAGKLFVQSVTVGLGLATVLQFVSARLVHGPARKRRLYLLWSGFCGIWLVYGLGISLVGGRLSPSVKMALFVAACAALAITQHLATPGYSGMMVENIPLRKRGRVGSCRMVALGLFGILGVALNARMMRRWEAPANFERAMAVGAAIMLLSCLTLLRISDEAGNQQAPAAKPLRVAASLKALRGNVNFRFFLIFYALLVTAQSLAPLLIGYGADALALPARSVSLFTGAYYGGVLLVAALLSQLADRHGFRLVAILSCLVMTLAFLLPLVAAQSRVALVVAYLLYAGSLSLNGVLLPNIGAEMAPGIKPAVLIAVGSFLAVPMGLVIAPLAGRLVDLHGQAGYLAVFVMGATLSFCAAIGHAAVVLEPRRGGEWIIRIRRV